MQFFILEPLYNGFSSFDVGPETPSCYFKQKICSKDKIRTPLHSQQPRVTFYPAELRIKNLSTDKVRTLLHSPQPRVAVYTGEVDFKQKICPQIRFKHSCIHRIESGSLYG